MIIAAYAGCGKTTFANEVWNSTDMVIVPYKYDVKSEPCSTDMEKNKASYGYDMNQNWPRNYISAVITAYHRYRYVLIPTSAPVLLELQRFRLPYILCYPDRALKEEYRQRYEDRGNSEEFMNTFIDGWDGFIDSFEADTYGNHIVLQSGEHLKDRLKEIETFTKTEESVIQVDIEDPMEKGIQKVFEETGVCIEEQLRQLIMYMVEHEELVEQWKNDNTIIPQDYEMMKIIL